MKGKNKTFLYIKRNNFYKNEEYYRKTEFSNPLLLSFLISLLLLLSEYNKNQNQKSQNTTKIFFLFF